jgi:hypothetical protein
MRRLSRFLISFSFSFSFALASLAGLPACSDASFITRYAPTYAHVPHKVSLLGVYKDGRMNSDIWEQIGPGLSAPLGGQCGPGYDTLVNSNPQLSAAIDDYARANGIGDELLDLLGPAAVGDLIMVVTVAGAVTPKGQNLPDTSTMSSGAPGGAMPGGSNKFRGASMNSTGPRSGGAMRRPLADGAALEMSASLFSVSEHRSVGMVSMAYSGASVDEAVQKLAARLGEELQGSSCVAWNWGAKVDDQRIRELVEH